MTADGFFFSIIVLGHMNPMIHHPFWYQQVGLLTEQERDEALHSQNTFVLPPIAQVAVGSFMLACQPNRWEAQTTDPTIVDRLRMMVERLFDKLLPHTPVTGYGTNFNFSRMTEKKDVGAFLASHLTPGALGLGTFPATTAELKIIHQTEGRKVMVSISQEDGDGIAVANNYEYPQPRLTPEQYGFFELADKLAATFDSDRRDAEERANAVIRAINLTTGE